MKRVIFDFLLILSLFLAPWWVSVLLMVALVLLFDNFYEFIFSAIILYGLYSFSNVRSITYIIIYAIVVNILYFGIQLIKSRIILYKNKSNTL